MPLIHILKFVDICKDFVIYLMNNLGVNEAFSDIKTCVRNFGGLNALKSLNKSGTEKNYSKDKVTG